MSAKWDGGDAAFSDCGRYRYRLDRWWNYGAGILIFIGLNPSTADAEKDDPTCAKEIRWAQREGYCHYVKLNLCAWRATNPRDMRQQGRAAIGPRNWEHIAEAVREAQAVESNKVVLAWGAGSGPGDYAHLYRHVAMVDLLRHLGSDLMCFGHTKDGYPRHPCRMSNDSRMIRY